MDWTLVLASVMAVVLAGCLIVALLDPERSS